MGYKVVWTDAALRDVEEIARYIEKDSQNYARVVVTKILGTTRLLERFPYSGRVIPEEKNELVRERFVYSYRIIYEIRGKAVYVLAVVHGRRDLSPRFGEEI